MTDEEKAAAAKAEQEAAEAAEAAKAAEDAEEAQKDAKVLAEKDAEIEKLKKDRDNYKKVALKRLGKLDNDADFLAGENDSGLTVEEQVKATLIDREIEKIQREKDEKVAQMAKENAELRLALKNRPGETVGGGTGSASVVETKDNVFSTAQLAAMRARAGALGLDPDRYIENAKKNMQGRA